MNRYPVAWTVRFAVADARRLPAARFDALLAALRSNPIEPRALRLQGWIIAAALVVPCAVAVAIVVGIGIASHGAFPGVVAVPSIAALIVASTYASSCLFSWLNALMSADAVRAWLADEATGMAAS